MQNESVHSVGAPLDTHSHTDVARPVVASPSVAKLHSYLYRPVATVQSRARIPEYTSQHDLMAGDTSGRRSVFSSERSRGWRVAICVTVGPYRGVR